MPIAVQTKTNVYSCKLYVSSLLPWEDLKIIISYEPHLFSVTCGIPEDVFWSRRFETTRSKSDPGYELPLSVMKLVLYREA